MTARSILDEHLADPDPERAGSWILKEPVKVVKTKGRYIRPLTVTKVDERGLMPNSGYVLEYKFWVYLKDFDLVESDRR